MLAELLARPPKRLVYSDHVFGQAAAFLARACEMKLARIVSKRRDAPYRSGRSAAWVKSKCLNREEFVVAGWTPPEGARVGFVSLVFGHYT